MLDFIYYPLLVLAGLVGLLLAFAVVYTLARLVTRAVLRSIDEHKREKKRQYRLKHPSPYRKE